MELTQLYQFREIALLGNMTRAAEKLFVSQPALSKSIQNLEQELGLQFFDRKKNRVVLNENGQAFLEQVNLVLSNVDKLRQFCEERRLADKPLRFVASDDRAYRHLIPSISRYCPDLEIESSLAAENLLCEMILNHEAAAAITTSPTQDPRLVALPLFTERACIIVPQGHSLYGREKLFLKDLDGETLIFSRNNETEAAAIARGYRKLGIQVKVRLSESWMMYSNVTQNTNCLIGASTISMKYREPNAHSRIIMIEDDIPELTSYHFYFVFSKDCRSMHELYAKLRSFF